MGHRFDTIGFIERIIQAAGPPYLREMAPGGVYR
jgi:hypothetical protein